MKIKDFNQPCDSELVTVHVAYAFTVLTPSIVDVSILPKNMANDKEKTKSDEALLVETLA
jgi:hypothetical protein